MITITIGSSVRQIDLPALQITGWREGWLPGEVDIWYAVRKFGTSWQLELEFSRRAPGWVDSIRIDGELTKTIPVGMAWPAGRCLCYRLGVDPVLHPSWRRRRQRFGPMDQPLPSIGDKAAQQADALQRLAGLRSAVAARATFQVENSIDAITGWIGPFPCYLPPDPGPGVPGGDGVYHSRGWQNCEGYFQLACDVSALAASRMWCFRRVSDGAPLSVDHYTISPTPNVVPAQGIKPPGWEGPDPLPFEVADSHLGRYLSWLIAAWEGTGSPLARRQIISIMEGKRLQWTERGVVATGSAGWVAENLSTYDALSQASPGQGGPWDRRHGWLGWGAAMLKKLGHWSPGWQAWSQRLLGALERSAMPSGLVGRGVRPDVSSLTDVAAAMHEALVGIGSLALWYRSGIARPDFLRRQALTLYVDGPTGHYFGQVGPLHFLAVAAHGGAPYLSITSGFAEPSLPGEPGDPAHVETHIACLVRLGMISPHICCLFGTTATSVAEKQAHLQAATNPMERHWTAFLLAELQAA